jgi:glutathione synthase/RimK-type ligase-like ATP-grasp enzyme
MNSVIDDTLARARAFAARGEDAAAKAAYVEALHLDPTDFAALNELGALALASGHRSAARAAYTQAVLHHPDNLIGHVNLGNLLLADGDMEGARPCYQAALDLDPRFPEAHQGLARVLAERGDAAADAHWQQGFEGHGVVTKPYRGVGPGIKLLLLVSARGGNIRTDAWINDRRFAITAIYTDFHDPTQSLPPHQLVFNAIGDAELCAEALARAELLVAHTTAPVINPPAAVRATGRADNARRLANVPGVIAPHTVTRSRTEIVALPESAFPLLLRAPGFHTGQHFHYVESPDAMAAAIRTMPGDEVLAIQYLDARGPDGMARKYRVMFVDGRLYPLHLAISAEWKVHYFTADMATNPAHRAEEQGFLEDMGAALGERAMTALAGINATLGLDYAGIDFALAPDGSVLLFEANATMVILPPDANPIWDYRRRAIAAVQQAVDAMLSRKLGLRRKPHQGALPPGPPPKASLWDPSI